MTDYADIETRRLRSKQGRARSYTRKLKSEVVAAYGGRCDCCGESELAFLQVDHANGDGAAHRREIGCVTGAPFWTWLRRHGFPRGLGIRVLCANCNMATRYGQACPHVAVAA